jgi:hypothetical protein
MHNVFDARKLGIAGKTPLGNSPAWSVSLKSRLKRAIIPGLRILARDLNISPLAKGGKNVDEDVGVLLDGFDLVHILFIAYGREQVNLIQ